MMHRLLQLGSLALLCAPSLAAPAEAAHALNLRQFNSAAFEFQCNHDQLMIAQEFASMVALATKGSHIVGASRYYQALFSTTNKNSPGFEVAVQTKYGKLAALANDPNYKVVVSCITDQCVDANGNNLFAWTSPGQKQINLCPSWFDDAKKVKAADVLSQCQQGAPQEGSWSNLSQFKKTKGSGFVPAASGSGD